MRSNTMIDAVLGRGKPSQEGSNLPVPSQEVDVVKTAEGVEQAETVEELLPIEVDPEEEREKLTQILEINESTPKIDPVAVQDGIREALESEFDPDDLLSGVTDDDDLTWDEMQEELVELGLDPEYEDEYNELMEMSDISNRVQVSLGMAKSMESATELDLRFTNINLDDYAKRLQVEVPRLRVKEGKVDKASLESLEAWNGRLQRFAVKAYQRIKR